ncbi:hypothetical protein ABZS88_37025 [Streptomyces sp. NPDC005480]|uniref:hypothetical protein n=1 Tax=Streptomyces sp. NPDC005480 TaxID=3154880 RepID=UPI0033B10E4A
MHKNQEPPFPGRLSKEQKAMEELLSRVNCNDRRERGREADEYARRIRQLTAVTFLSAVL